MQGSASKPINKLALSYLAVPILPLLFAFYIARGPGLFGTGPNELEKLFATAVLANAVIRFIALGVFLLRMKYGKLVLYIVAASDLMFLLYKITH